MPVHVFMSHMQVMLQAAPSLWQPVQLAVLGSSVGVCLEYTFSISTAGLPKEKGAAASIEQGCRSLAFWAGLQGTVGKVSYINNNPKLLEAVAFILKSLKKM